MYNSHDIMNFARSTVHESVQRKRQDEERAETIRKIQEAATKRHQEEAAGGVPGSPGIGAAAAGLGRGAGSIAALEESMGRGRGRGMSNLPAWMTKAKAKAPAAPDASMDDVSARVRSAEVPHFFLYLFLFDVWSTLA